MSDQRLKNWTGARRLACSAPRARRWWPATDRHQRASAQ